MITEIEIKNYKSIDKLALQLGRINVFIGENGAGKSNILEVIALAGAAAAEKLDNEFLTSRGIRVTQPEYMRSALPGAVASTPISISLSNDKRKIASFELSNDNSPYSKWTSALSDVDNVKLDFTSFVSALEKFEKSPNKDSEKHKNEIQDLLNTLQSWTKQLNKVTSTLKSKEKNKARTAQAFSTPINVPLQLDADSDFAKILINTTIKKTQEILELSNFVIYSPENTSLRTFQREGQIEPLGINGEGLLKLLSLYSQDPNSTTLIEIKSSLKLLEWFEDFKTSDQIGDGRLEIKDRFLDKNVREFDHKSTNEGFFFLLFYFALFGSELTPKFFAIDNIDASLNPKLCQKLMIELVKLSRNNDKQVILTTHNPSILDGLNLDDDEQRLFVISRSRTGATKIKRIHKPVTTNEPHPYRLSELFLRGILGGLPKGF